MRSYFEALRKPRRNNTTYGNRRVWMFKTCIKNLRFKKARLSDNHSVKTGYQPIRGTQDGSRVSLSEIMGGAGFFGTLVSMSLQDPEGMISIPGVIVFCVSLALVMLSAVMEEPKK